MQAYATFCLSGFGRPDEDGGRHDRDGAERDRGEPRARSEPQDQSHQARPLSLIHI